MIYYISAVTYADKTSGKILVTLVNSKGETAVLPLWITDANDYKKYYLGKEVEVKLV